MIEMLQYYVNSLAMTDSRFCS